MSKKMYHRLRPNDNLECLEVYTLVLMIPMLIEVFPLYIVHTYSNDTYSYESNKKAESQKINVNSPRFISTLRRALEEMFLFMDKCVFCRKKNE